MKTDQESPMIYRYFANLIDPAVNPDLSPKVPLWQRLLGRGA